MAVPWLSGIFDFILRHGLGLSRLRARPKGFALWNPKASRTVIVGFAANDRSGSVASRHCPACETFNLRFAPIDGRWIHEF